MDMEVDARMGTQADTGWEMHLYQSKRGAADDLAKLGERHRVGAYQPARRTRTRALSRWVNTTGWVQLA